MFQLCFKGDSQGGQERRGSQRGFTGNKVEGGGSRDIVGLSGFGEGRGKGVWEGSKEEEGGQGI